MKKLIMIPYLILIICCQNESININTTSENKDTTIAQNSDKKKKYYNVDYEDILFNDHFIGLSLINDRADNINERLGFNFSTSCMASGVSFKINLSKNKLYFSTYMDLYENEGNFENEYLYALYIDTIFLKDNYIHIKTDGGNFKKFRNEVFNNHFEFLLKKIEGFPIYSFETKDTIGLLGSGFSNLIEYNYFVNEMNKHIFPKEDCGDFDG